jgi:hypothetical protein
MEICFLKFADTMLHAQNAIAGFCEKNPSAGCGPDNPVFRGHVPDLGKHCGDRAEMFKGLVDDC